MKREERKVYNSLKKTVTGDTLYVEIPTNWTHEARQAIHELLTVEKGMFATVIGPDCRTFKETIRYTHSSEATKATRQAQEVTDIDEVMKELRYTDCTWNGYKANEEEEPATAEPAHTESKEEEKKMEYTISKNPDYNSIEITFAEKPAEEVRAALKALKYRWHSVKRVWYGYTTEEEARAAIEGKKAESKPERKEEPKANKFGVKVGDLFHASWGYDQTNNDFFQVIELVGTSSVRVREVYPVCEQSEATCWAAEDRVFSTNTNGKLLPPAKYSTFIKDQENGDLKRLKSYAADGKSNPQFYLSSFADAYYCGGDTIKVYESWYA